MSLLDGYVFVHRRPVQANDSDVSSVGIESDALPPVIYAEEFNDPNIQLVISFGDETIGKVHQARSMIHGKFPKHF
jgi:hypothetical protein